MDIKSLTSAQAREALGEKQKALGAIFEQALVTGDSGRKQYDFNKVTSLGADVKGSIAVAEKVKQLNAEADELAQHAETLEAAEDAAKGYAAREKGIRRFPLPGGGDGAERGGRQIKSLGQHVADMKAFKSWHSAGASGGIILQLDDVYATDMLAGAAAFETIGQKALMSTSSGYAPESVRQAGFVEAATGPIEMLDIIPLFRTDQASVKYMEETTRVHGAAEVAEGDTYAESQFAFTEKESPVRKIGDSLPVTDEQLEDVAMMEGYINTRLPFGVRQRLGSQCLIGNGTAPNLRGLANVAGIQSQARGADPVPDVFYKMMTKVRITGRSVPTHHLCHPLDWQDVRLLRTADGVYIYGPPSDAAAARLWGLPVVEVEAGGQGTGYTGSFRPDAVSLHERRGVEVQIGFVGTQFLQGRRTVRADMRAALVWWRPAGFCEGTGL